MSRELLFSVTAKDCDWSFTKGSGKGGQKRNKTSSAVHCFHRPSNSHGYSEASRSQRENKETAFKRMAQTPEFQNWLKLESAKRTGLLKQIEEEVENQLQNIRIEVKSDGRWVECAQ